MKLGHFVACERDSFCKLSRNHANINIVTKLAELTKFHVYIVEQWITDRRRFSKSVVAYTADPLHAIKVCVLDFDQNHTMQYAKKVEQIFAQYQEDKVRSMETPLGTILVTDLRKFPPSFNLIHLPDGNYDAHYNNLVISLNLRRFGCTGRASVALIAPSNAKLKFMQHYKIHRDVSLDFACREVVALTQVILSVFDFFPREYIDGLFCDTTISSLRRFRDLYVNFGESSEDTLLSPELFSFMLVKYINLRNKLYYLGYHDVPKDPFTQMDDMIKAICAFQETHDQIATGQLDDVSLKFIDNLALSRLQTTKGAHVLGQLPKSFRWRFDAYPGISPPSTPLHMFSSVQTVPPAISYGNTTIVDLALIGQHCTIDRVRYLITGKGKLRGISNDRSGITVNEENADVRSTDSAGSDGKPMANIPFQFIRGMGEDVVGTISGPMRALKRQQQQAPSVSSAKSDNNEKAKKGHQKKKSISKESVESDTMSSTAKAPSVVTLPSWRGHRRYDSQPSFEGHSLSRDSASLQIEEGRRGSLLSIPNVGKESTVNKLLFDNVVADRRVLKTEDEMERFKLRESQEYEKIRKHSGHSDTNITRDNDDNDESNTDSDSDHNDSDNDSGADNDRNKNHGMRGSKPPGMTKESGGHARSGSEKKKGIFSLGDNNDEFDNKRRTDASNMALLEGLIVENHLIDVEIMAAMHKKEKELDALRELLDGQVRDATERVERLELLHERQLTAYRDYELLIHSMLEDNDETNELVKMLDDQANKLKYNLHSSDEKLKETAEVIDNLKTKLSTIEKDLTRRKDAWSVTTMASNLRHKLGLSFESTRQFFADLVSTIYDYVRVYFHTHHPYLPDHSH